MKRFINVELILFLVATALCLGLIGPSIYGLVLAFRASILLGIIVLIVQPSPFILGVIALSGHAEASVKLAQWMHLPF